MPSLRIFGRRTLLGGDDLQIPSLLTVLVRVVQLAFLLVPLYLHIGREATREGGLAGWLSLSWDDAANNNCDDGDGTGGGGAHRRYFPLLLFVYTIGTTLYTALTIRLESRLYRKAGIGTPTERTDLRQRAVAPLLERKLVPVALGNVLIWSVGVAAIVLSGPYYACRQGAGGAGGGGDNNEAASDDDIIHTDVLPYVHPHLWWYALTLLLLTQFAEVVLSAWAIWRICSLPKRESDVVSFPRESEGAVGAGGAVAGAEQQQRSPSPSSSLPHYVHYVAQHHRHQHHELAEEMWRDRCRLFCRCLSVSTCFLFGGREVDSGDYTAVARALADYFEEGDALDLVPSDVVAGFVMLQRIQRQRVLEARRAVIESRRTVESLEDGHAGSTSTVSSLRDSALKRSAHESIFAGGGGGGNGSVGSVGAPASPALSRPRTSSRASLSPMPDPRTPAPDRSAALYSDSVYPSDPSALAFRMEHNANRTWYETTSRSVLCRNDEEDRAMIAEGARFARHALAIYTWVLYVYMHPIKGPCKMACAPCIGRSFSRRRRQNQSPSSAGSSHRRRGSQQQHDAAVTSPSSTGLLRSEDIDDQDEEYSYNSCPVDDGRIIGDNCCHVHRATLLAHAGLEDSDLVYAQLNCSYRETPYCIVLDHRWKTVVLAIRGTLSIEDCIVDVLVDPESLEGLGTEYGFDGQGQACHRGALDETRWIMDDLRAHRILERLLLGPNAEYSHYNLRIVGHSLGAACACLLSFMLRRQYPTLRCVCYSPPGGFITRKLAEGCKDFVSSFVLDSDLVPRLSVDSMEHLRNEVLEVIGRIKVPKVKIVEHALHVSGVIPCNNKVEDDPDVLVETNARLLYPEGSVPADTEFARQLERVKSAQSERRKIRSGIRDVPLYPPGRICHLVKTGQKRRCYHGLIKCLTCFTTNAGSEYTPIWVENDDLNEIVIAPTMGTDHFPDRVCLELEGVAANNFGIDTSLGSTEVDRENALRSTNGSSAGDDIANVIFQ